MPSVRCTPGSQSSRRSASLATPEPLNVRLGVASGLVVVGDLIGAGAAQERGVVGETPNLAARLQSLATPGTLVIAESTRRQIGALFELEDLGPQPLAGFAEPQRAWRVVGESGVLSRFEALRSGTTPLVGRDEEVELLIRRWQQAKSGEGRVVLISGEPGIGKSRLTAALSERIGDRAAYPPALFLLAAPSGQRALPVHRPARTRRRVRSRRRGRSKARQAEGIAGPRHSGGRDCSVGRAAVVAEFRRQPKLQPATQTREIVRGAARSARSRGKAAAGADGVRRRPLDRSDLARVPRSDHRPGTAAAGAAVDHLSPRISAALGRSLTRHELGAQPARRTRRRDSGAKAAANAALTPRSSPRSSSAPMGCRSLSRS